MQNNFSVLMSVYFKDKPEYLSEALKSVFEQTLKPKEVILVKDGKLGDELDQTIKLWEEKEKGILKCIQIEGNVGLAHALNCGLEHCSCELVARMDADDVCVVDRFKKQISYLHSKNLDVVGAYVEERDEKMEHVFGIKKVPLGQEDIVRYSRWRNPINHMTALFKKSAVMSVGGYSPELKTQLEDYWLWVQIVNAGYKIGNVPEPLVVVRTGKDFLCRRGGWGYFKHDVVVLYYMKRIGHINFFCFIIGVIIRFFARVGPVSIRRLLYKKMRMYEA
jgi:glycosyltransferase involved in cell wall biosynthesis